MNRGTAMKWIERLEACEHQYDNSQLGFVDHSDGSFYMSPLGVLCEFLDPDGITVSSGDIQWQAETFVVPASLMKRAKIKSQWLDHTANGEDMTIYDGIDKAVGYWVNSPFIAAAKYVEEHYPNF